jgi:hypothetical protein
MKSRPYKRRMAVRTAQKQSMRYAAAAGSALALTLATIIYLNFSHESTMAESVNNPARPDYSTASTVVSERLLLKSLPQSESSVQQRVGRSMKINPDRYISE